MNFYVRFARWSKPEMEPQVALRDVAPAAANFIHLPVAAVGCTKYPGTDARPIALDTDCLDLDPMILKGAVATKELRIIIDAIHNHVQIAVVVEVADGASASWNQFLNAGPGIKRYIHKLSVPVVVIKHLPFSVSGFVGAFAYFGIDVSVASQDVRPPIVIEIEKACSPTEKSRIASQSRLKCHVF